MKPSEIVSVKVTGVSESGIEIEHEGHPGFVQPIELSWVDAPKANEFAKVGDSLTVLVYAVTADRFYASVRQADPSADPWRDPRRFAAGTTHVGRVTAVVDWGWRVELVPGVAGMILRERFAGEHSTGDELQVTVIELDEGSKRLELKPT